MSTVCHYCDLPMAPQGDIKGPHFCCWGCRFAWQVTGSEGESAQSRMALTRLGIAIFFTMNVMVLTLALWSKDIYGEASVGQATALYDLLRYASLFLASVVLALLGWPFAEEAGRRLQIREISTELLVVVGVFAAYTYSAYAVWTNGTHTYFEVVCMVLVAMTLGKWLQASGRVRTTSVLRQLESLLPETVRQVSTSSDRASANTDLTVVSIRDVVAGGLVQLQPGERIPFDGLIRQGQALVDEQIVTGESVTATREVGDSVVAGSLNTDGNLIIEVIAGYNEGTLKKIVEAVVEASRKQTPWQQRADRWTARFLPAVAAAAAVTVGYHWSVTGLGEGILCGLAVLLIACPCALGFATPLAECTAIIKAAQRGIIICRGEALERLSQCKILCVDKTGTLSNGELAVDRVVVDPSTNSSIAMNIARHLAADSAHCMSRAVHRFASTNGADRMDATTDTQRSALSKLPRHVPGRGLVASGPPDVNPTEVALGNLALMKECDCVVGPKLQTSIDLAMGQGESFACLAWDRRVRAHFVCQERLRPDAKEVLERLKQNGWRVIVATGDNAGRAAAVGEELGVEVQSELLPQHKSELIRELQKSGTGVAMLGDGANDAPAIMQADVGLAMGCGADISRDAADICLRGSDLSQAELAIKIAKRTATTIRQNLLWAFGYNFVGVCLAATGRLNPIWAAVAMVGSSLLVIANSVRMLGDHRVD